MSLPHCVASHYCGLQRHSVSGYFIMVNVVTNVTANIMSLLAPPSLCHNCHHPHYVTTVVIMSLLSSPSLCHYCHHHHYVTTVTTITMSLLSPPSLCHYCHHHHYVTTVTTITMSLLSPPSLCHLSPPSLCHYCHHHHYVTTITMSLSLLLLHHSLPLSEDVYSFHPPLGTMERNPPMKYILVSGGVISGVGKGVITSSIGTLLKSVGLKVTAIKIDPYLNIDAGTFSPYEHGKMEYLWFQCVAV